MCSFLCKYVCIRIDNLLIPDSALHKTDTEHVSAVFNKHLRAQKDYKGQKQMKFLTSLTCYLGRNFIHLQGSF